MPADAGIGVKPTSKTASERIGRKALQYAVANNVRTVTLVPNGNIMKYTEGAFRAWGFELPRREFGDLIITGANFGEHVAVFEAMHGTDPRYAGRDRVNPGSPIRSAAMMIGHIGWPEAAGSIEAALAAVIADRVVIYDLARLMNGARTVGTSDFAAVIVGRMTV